MTDLLTAQYALVQSSPSTLLGYCATLTPADFTAPVAAFNDSSLRNLLVHVANMYRHWLGVVAQNQLGSYYAPAQVPDVAAVRQIFQEIDELVATYATHIGSNWQTPQTVAVSGRSAPLTLTPLALFTHVVTHEFHHKGQLLSMSRQLGYTPIDTDVIRF